MNKKIVYFITSLCSLLPVGIISAAVSITNPLGSNTIIELLTRIAEKIGELIAYLGGIMIVVAGILYLTSAGNTEKINKAKAALTYAIIGIFVGLMAKGIVAGIKQVMGIP